MFDEERLKRAIEELLRDCVLNNVSPADTAYYVLETVKDPAFAGEVLAYSVGCPPPSQEMIDDEVECPPPALVPADESLFGMECGACGADMVGDRRLIVTALMAAFPGPVVDASGVAGDTP